MNGRSAFRSILAIFATAILLATRTAYASHGPSITAVAIDPQTPTTLYAGTPDRGVFKSVDAGATWILTGLIGIRVTSLAIDPRNPSTVYAGTQGGGVFRFKSADDGGTWVAINTGLLYLDVAAVVVDPRSSTTLYALVPWVGLFKSTNSGDTWIPILLNGDIPDAPCCWYLAIAAQTSTTLYAGTDVGLFETTGSTEIWTPTGLFQTLSFTPPRRFGPAHKEHFDDLSPKRSDCRCPRRSSRVLSDRGAEVLRLVRAGQSWTGRQLVRQ
jgi:hypothetical protein